MEMQVDPMNYRAELMRFEDEQYAIRDLKRNGAKKAWRASSILLAGMAIMMMLASIVIVSPPASATIYTFVCDNNPNTVPPDGPGDYAYAWYTWDDSLARTVTLSVNVYDDPINVDAVDVFFFNEYNFNVYALGSSSPTYIHSELKVYEGLHTYTFTLNPVAYPAKYYVVIDNQNRYDSYGNLVGAAQVPYVQGSFELSSAYTTHLLYGYVYLKIGDYGTTTPVPGATISLTGGYVATSDAYGYYSISLPDGTYTATVSAAGYQTVTQTVTMSGYANNEDFLLPAAQRHLTGHVYVSGTSTPVVGASILISPGSYSLTTDSAGYYSISLQDGTYSLSVTATGYQSKTDTVPISGSDVQYDVQLTLLPSTYQVSGYVYRTGTTTGISGVTLSFSPGSYSATTDSSGHYVVSGVSSGAYSVTMTASGYQSASGSVTVSGADATKDFEMSVSSSGNHVISGYVYKTGTTTGISGATLTATPGSLSATTDSMGHYTISGLADGTYSIAVSASGYQGNTVSVTVSGSDATKNIELSATVPNTHSVSGYVYKTGTSTGISGATLTATPGSLSATTDSSGHYSISGLADGTYSIAVSASGYQGNTVSVTVSGSDATKNIELSATGQSTPPPDDGGRSASTLSGPVVAGVMVAIVAAIGAVVILQVMKRKKMGIPPMQNQQLPVPPPPPLEQQPPGPPPP